MATKAEIGSQIQTINDGGLNTAVELRGVLGDDNPNSLLENIYGDVIVETNVTETVFSISANALITEFSFTLDANITKVGNLIHVTGFIESHFPVAVTSVRLNCVDVEYYGKQDLVFYGWSDKGRINMTNTVANGCYINIGTMLGGEILAFSILYTANI